MDADELSTLRANRLPPRPRVLLGAAVHAVLAANGPPGRGREPGPCG